MPCEKHSPSWDGFVPGSILCTEVVLTDQFSEQLIRREAMLHLKYWQEIQNGKETESERSPG